MRGKVGGEGEGKDRVRITPAYAGKSGLRSKVERNDGDHPRLCGEKNIGRLKRRMRQGSPPPMRGKDRRWKLQQNLRRITPAYAGKSLFPQDMFHTT